MYIACNSGARIGLADELKQLFRVAWVNPAAPDNGFKYLYLTPADYMKVVWLKMVIFSFTTATQCDIL